MTLRIMVISLNCPISLTLLGIDPLLNCNRMVKYGNLLIGLVVRAEGKVDWSLDRGRKWYVLQPNVQHAPVYHVAYKRYRVTKHLVDLR